jgi:hypothetical protein
MHNATAIALIVKVNLQMSMAAFSQLSANVGFDGQFRVRSKL